MKAQVFRLLVFIFLYVKVCFAEKRNITIGSKTYNVQRAEEHINAYSQCYVDIVVYNSTSFKYGLKNASVIVLSGQLDDPTLEFSEGWTDSTGHSCVPVACRDEARIFVEKSSVRLSALNETIQKQNLPQRFYVGLETNNEIIRCYVNPWGMIQGRSGPIYSTKEKQKCQNASDSDFHFAFSYISIPDLLTSTQTPPQNINNLKDPNFYKLWYYGREPTLPVQYCYFKVKVKTTSHQVVIKAFSKLNDSNGMVYGLFQTGPQYDVSSFDTIEQAACVEFRCPATDIFPNKPPMDIYIQGTIEIPGRTEGCCVRNDVSNLFQVSPKSFSTNNALSAGKKYGSKYGIYMNEKKDVARLKCFTGHEILVSEYAMNATIGFAFAYDCLSNINCTKVPNVIIGK